MYFYRNLPPELKAEVLRQRQLAEYPLHAPPHPRKAAGWFLISAATYEHQAHFTTPALRSELLAALLRELSAVGSNCAGLVVLPNHYHLLLHCERLGDLSRALGRAHGRTSRAINEREGVVGRRVWYRFSDRQIRSERHYWASLNYVHHNPVKHGYVAEAGLWSASSIHWYVERLGAEHLEAIWAEHPVKAYGAGWDD